MVDHPNSPNVFRNIVGVNLTDQGDGVLHLEQVRASVQACALLCECPVLSL